MNRLRTLALSLAAAMALAAWWLSSRVAAPTSEPPAPPATLRDSTGPLTLAAAGDTSVPRPLPQPGVDPGFDEVVRILRGASLAFTNLEGQLRRADAGGASAGPRWSAGTPETARELRRIGFTLVSRANNHAADGGAESIGETTAALDAAGLLSAGCGGDLDGARAPALVGAAPRRVALVAVTTSASDEARATKTRGEIQGRAGVNVVRYVPDVTADPVTYAALRRMAIASHQIEETTSELRLSGRLIRKGAATTVDLVADQNDVEEALAAIAKARAAADIVVVSLHSHEPGNRSDTPAAFVQRFARMAIDRGASLVIGHGPHRLRGIEIYKGGAILYSLGSFAFQYAAIDPRAPGVSDVFDADTDLDEIAITAPAGPGSFVPLSFDEPVWWESVVATATFDGGVLKRIRLDPIDLGVDLPQKDRGTPRAADAGRGAAILRRLADLSSGSNTAIRMEDGAGIVDLPPGP
jgi:poly-gamma-glutamate capsule biosynthesis protein CapA/YwtB (metallophosphatase superfamily)